MTRTPEQLLNLSRRVQAHCKAGPWSKATDARVNTDGDRFRRGDLGTDDQSMFDVSRVLRWVVSWNRRQKIVADAVAQMLSEHGVPS